MSKTKLVITVVALAAIFFGTRLLKKNDQQPIPAPVIVESNLKINEEPIEVAEESIDSSQPEMILDEVVYDEPVRGIPSTSKDADLPQEIDLMPFLFQPFPPHLPIVETVSYSSRVSWVTGRQAYIGDYASYYHTSKHFISRSLKGKGKYFSEAISKGDRFNVLSKEKQIEFHLVLDLSRLKLWIYYFDKNENEKMLLKSYRVCAGRLDPEKPSGCLTPTGTFQLGKDIAVYKEGMKETLKNQSREIVSVFGKRWIPLEKPIANCTGSCKGLGFQGTPWKFQEETGTYLENRECIGHYESNGCIRLLTEDIEELFAVVISRPSFVHIVKDFQEAKVPGVEKKFTETH